MQGLADGYFVIPYTIGDYFARYEPQKKPVSVDQSEFKAAEAEVQARIDKFMSIGGEHSVDYFHKKLGRIMWNECGMGRNKQGLEKALKEIPELRDEFWNNVKLVG
jgi:succinate dehydrogenase / fumarate reductase flavoprotein subunit